MSRYETSNLIYEISHQTSLVQVVPQNDGTILLIIRKLVVNQ